MNQKKLKNWKTLAGEWKEQRKTKLTPEQINDLNNQFDKIEKQQQEDHRKEEEYKRKIAKQAEI